MREIKFRCWDKTMKRWWCEDSQYLQMDGKKIHPAPWSTLTTDLPDDTICIQQYTGLKDKNGVEIYEGDIIKLFNDNLHKVEFIEESNEVEMSGYFFSSFGCEVIGNIFENPELLES